MKRIKYVSLFFRVLFQIIFVCLILIQIVGWVYAPVQFQYFNVVPNFYYSYVFYNHFDLNTKIAGFFITLIPTLIQLTVVYSLIRLFQLYERHEFFSIKNVFHIRQAGYALLLLQFLTPICNFLLGFVLTSVNPPGYRFARLNINDTNIGLIFTALIIILISWIMSEGRKLQDDQQLTI